MIGNYILSRWNSYGADLALILENTNALFDINRDKTNVLVFIDREDVENNNNLNMFLALNIAKDPYFNVAITTNHDPNIARDADVIINLFSSISKGFNSDLMSYDNGSKYFVSEDEFNQINNMNALRDFIKDLKNGFKLKIKVGNRK